MFRYMFTGAIAILSFQAFAQSSADHSAGILGRLRTGQAVSYADYDDAWYVQHGQIGAGPNYTDIGNNVIRDNLTNLYWIKDPSLLSLAFGKPGVPLALTASEATSRCAELNYGGNSDWRLPEITELYTCMNVSQPQPLPLYMFPFVRWWTDEERFWTGTQVAYEIGQNVWVADFHRGDLYDIAITSPNGYFVRPVRSDVSTSTTRFSASANGKTVTDVISGLMWVSNPNDAGVLQKYNWPGAIHACEGLQYEGYSDWRLPNRNELLSLVDYGRANPAQDATLFPFVASKYWTSTTLENNYFDQSIVAAWIIDFATGKVDTARKYQEDLYIRPVRSLQHSQVGGWQDYSTKAQ